MPHDANTNRLDLRSKADFEHLSDIVYLNTAAVGPMPRTVIEAGEQYDRIYAGRGALEGRDAEVETRDQIVEEVRGQAARLIGCSSSDVAMVGGVSEAISQCAWGLRPARGQNVVCIEGDFSAVTYPWLRVAKDAGMEVRFVPAHDLSSIFERLVDAIDSRTAVVCVSQVMFNTGYRLPLRDLSSAAHARGALVIVDAMQAAGTVPIDVLDDGVDVLVAGSYKWLCGDFGSGFCYMNPEMATRMEPAFVGYRGTIHPDQDISTTYSLTMSARRLEYATPSFRAVSQLGRAMEYLMSMGLDRIFEHNSSLAFACANALREAGAEVVSPTTNEDMAGIVAAKIPNVSSGDVVKRLAEQGIFTALRDGKVRCSFHVFNSGDDVEAVVSGFRAILGS